MPDITANFAYYLATFGIVPTKPLIADGTLHRAHVEDDSAGSRNLAYVIHTDGIPSGWFKNHRTGDEGRWKLKLTDDEKKELKSNAKTEDFAKMKAEREALELQMQAEAAKECRQIWLIKTGLPIGHKYLRDKKIRYHHARLTLYKKMFDALTVPIVDGKGQLCNLQYIYYENGQCKKRFHKDAKKTGCYSAFGVPDDTILIGEGFSTCASIFESTGLYTVCALDAGNLPSVVKNIRAKFPKAEIVICADNDESKVGQKAAESSVLDANFLVIMPPVVGMDFNDYRNAGGVIEIVKLIKEPLKTQVLIKFSEETNAN